MSICTATCGTYRCGLDDDGHTEHATLAGLVDSRTVRILRWGPDGERWTSRRILGGAR